MNENKEKNLGVLRCTACGDLTPADICGKCEGCDKNGEFADAGGCPALLLTGDREEVAAAVRKNGVMFENVVVVNAERFRRMEEALKKIAEYEISDDFEVCEQAGGYLKMLAQKAVER